MTKTTNSNHTSATSPGNTFNSRISADADAFDRNDVDALGSALDQHTHASGLGLAVARLAATAAISGGGTLTWPTSTDTVVGKATTDALTNKTLTSATNTVQPPAVSLQIFTNAIGGDVTLNNTGTFFDGPAIAQGTSGTWWASGTVTLVDTAGQATFIVKLWDGTTVIAAATVVSPGANLVVQAHLSGYLATPAGNIRISVKDVTATTGKILANNSGTSKDGVVSAVRIA